MANYREVTLNEMEMILSKANDIANRREYAAFVREFYGPEAYRIEILPESVYDDEGGYDDRIENVTVEDIDGNVMEFVESDAKLAEVAEYNREMLVTFPNREYLTTVKDFYDNALNDLPVPNFAYYGDGYELNLENFDAATLPRVFVLED